MSETEYFKGDGFRGSLLKELNAQLNAALNGAFEREAGKIVCARADAKDHEGVRAVVENYPALVNGRDAANDTVLICTVFAGDQDTFDYVLNKPNVDINAEGEHRSTALMHATREQSPHFAFKLLERPDINVTKQDAFGDTAVIDAVEAENLEVLERLLPKKGVDVMQRNNEGDSAASLAEKLSSNSKNDRIRELIKRHESYKEPASRRQAGRRRSAKVNEAAAEVADRTPGPPGAELKTGTEFSDIKSDSLRKLASDHPYPHSLAFLRWADGQGFNSITSMSKVIRHGESGLTQPTLMKFITEEHAMYGNTASRGKYDSRALAICTHIGYNPSDDYPLVSGTARSTQRPSADNT